MTDLMSPGGDRVEDELDATTQVPVSRSRLQLSVRRRAPIIAIVGPIAVIMAFLVIYPILKILDQAFLSHNALSSHGSITATFTDPALVPALENTAILLVVSGGLALLIGSLLAWLNERTDARVGWAGDILPVLPLMLPPVAAAIGWTFLLAPHPGFLNVAFRAVFEPNAPASAGGPLNIYTLIGIIFVTTLSAVPFVYLTMAAALRRLDPSLEEASRMSGAGAFRTFSRVTLPALRNALAAASALVLITIISMFAIPLVIGEQAGVNVLSVLIFQVLFVTSPPSLNQAVVLGVFMLLAVQLIVLAQYTMSRRGRHATIGGTAGTSTLVSLGAWRWPFRVFMVTYLGMTTVLPIGGLLLVSLEHFWSASIPWGQLSFTSYQQLFNNQNSLRQALENSLILAVLAATSLMIIAALMVVLIQSSSPVVARLVNWVTALPSSLPHIVVGLGLLISFGVGRFSLAGTLLLLYIAYLILFIPQAMRSAEATHSQVGRVLTEASLMSGASQWRTFVRVLLPLMFYGLIAGWVIIFAQTMSEMTAGIFLSNSSNPVVGPVILVQWLVGGTYPSLAALTLLVTLIQSAVVLGILFVTRRRQA